MQVFVALVCLLPSFSLWAANGQNETPIDTLGDPDRYNDKRQNYGVCCNGRRRAGKRTFNADSRLLKLLELAFEEPQQQNQIPLSVRSDAPSEGRPCCGGSKFGANPEQVQRDLLWKAFMSTKSNNNAVVKREPEPIGVSFGG